MSTEVKKVKLKIECPVIDEKNLTFQPTDSFIEQGAYGKVCKATYEGNPVAVKYFKSAEEKRGYKQELVFLKCLQKHDNIVILYGTGSSLKTKEYYNHSYPRYVYGADHVMHWSRQAAVGLKYIHSKRILHRDIKSSNLLLFGNGCHLKLCDFGTCRNLETNLLYTASIGTVRYMAPEVIQGDTYTTMCDIFSFAITLWEMVARKVPTIDSVNANSYAILYQMVQGKRPPIIINVPRFINELLTRCWHQDPAMRLSSDELEKKFTNVCKYFHYGRPLLLESDVDINDWLQGSYVQLTVTRVTMHGPPGAGKTCTQDLLLNKPPRKDHTSTPIARSAVTSTRISTGDGEIWKEITTDEMFGGLALELEKVGCISESANNNNGIQLKDVNAAASDDSSLSSVAISSASNEFSAEISLYSSTNADAVDRSTITDNSFTRDDSLIGTHDAVSPDVISKINDLLNNAKKVDLSKHWIYFIDSGGQPAFQELLPLFVRSASVNVITINMSEGLDKEFEFQYRIQGKSKPLGSNTTNRRAIEQALVNATIWKPDDTGETSHTVNIILGTHSDLVSDEDIKNINKGLRPLLRDHSSDVTHVYPINTLVEGNDENDDNKNRKKQGDKLRNLIMERSKKQKTYIQRKIPIRWFVFELYLQLLCKKEGQCFLAKDKVYSAGRKFRMKEIEIFKALMYLHNVTILLYFHEILPDIVFIDPQPILETLSYVIALSHTDPSLILDPNNCITQYDLDELTYRGNLTENLLNDSCFPLLSTDSFKPSDFLKLLKHLNIIFSHPDGCNFLPCALSSFKGSDMLSVIDQPFLIVWPHFSQNNTTLLAVPAGVFPLTIVHLLNDQQVQVQYPPIEDEELHDSCYYKFRNAMSLWVSIDGKRETIHIFKGRKYIKVYYTGPKELCPQIHKLVTSAIIKSSLNINIPNNFKTAFHCPNNEKCYCIVQEDVTVVNCSHCSSPVNSNTITSCELYECWITTNNVTADKQEPHDCKDNNISQLRQRIASNTDHITWSTNFRNKNLEPHSVIYYYNKFTLLAIVFLIVAIIFGLLKYYNNNNLPDKYEFDDNSCKFDEQTKLEVSALNDVYTTLKQGHFDLSKWFELGLELGLHSNTLTVIETNFSKDVETCLRKCLTKWLERSDGVDERGVPTWLTLIDALEKIKYRATSDHIRKRITIKSS